LSSSSPSSLGGYDLDDDLLIEHSQHLSCHVRQLRRNDGKDAIYDGGAFATSFDDGDGGGSGKRDGGNDN